MALAITSLCVNCWACEPLCPNKAIREAKPHFVIDAKLCSECLGDYEVAQCAAICPIECAIVDQFGQPLNPPGSLTGIAAVTPPRVGEGTALPCPAGEAG